MTQETELDHAVWEAIIEPSSTEPLNLEENLPRPNDVENYTRNAKNCRTLVVGDQGTNKIIRSVKFKSSSAYGDGLQRFLEICMPEVHFGCCYVALVRFHTVVFL